MDNNIGRHLCGIEVEYGFAARDGSGSQLPTGYVLDLFFDVCRRVLVYLPGSGGTRLFLENGALVYPDVGHPEMSGPESESPMDLLHSLRAGESLLAAIAAEVENADEIGDLNLFRSNVDYWALGTTWGCHESYLSRRRPETFAKNVVAHLASRIIYTGSGGFDNRSFTATFAVSPRVYHLNDVIGNDRGGRAIFGLRNESLSRRGHSRVHLACGEHNCADLATYLKFGTTSLVLAMADAGADFGGLDRVLRSPLAAIHDFTADTDCRVIVQGYGGSRTSALAIQQSYLALAEANIEAAYMPAWAPEVCARWRQVLETLEAGPEAAVGLLDWPTKLAIFKHYVGAHSGFEWDRLGVWGAVASGACRALANKSGDEVRLRSRRIKSCLDRPSSAARELRELSRVLDAHDYSWDEIDAFVALRNDLCELDVRYGQLYPKGIYVDLEEQGRLCDGLVDGAEIEAAKRRAPGQGRARLRGDWIATLANREQRYYCDWSSIMSLDEHLDLGDPFASDAVWVPTERLPLRRRFPPQLDCE